MILTFYTVATVLFFFIGFFVHDAHAYKRWLDDNYETRIHVNGTRGKSSVTRLIAAGMREAGHTTLCKTTGSAAMISYDQDKEYPVVRKGKPDISEQLKTIKDSAKLSQNGENKFDALVMECMAINPLYQKYLEEKVMYSKIVVITNVRLDHTDLMGNSLEEIAHSFSLAIPRNGHLVIGEKNKTLVEVFAKACKKRNTEMHRACFVRVSKKDIDLLPYPEFKENLQVCLKVASILRIPRKVFYKGMLKVMPDPGRMAIYELKTNSNRRVFWVNLMAVNDTESMPGAVSLVKNKINAQGVKIPKVCVLLNNRKDRPERVKQFFNIALDIIKADQIVATGDYTGKIAKLYEKSDKGVNKNKHKGLQLVEITEASAKHLTGADILDTIIGTDKSDLLIIGTANIHTLTAQKLLEEIEVRKLYEIN